MYVLKELKRNMIKGMFYAVESEKVEKEKNSLWFIYQILRKIQRNQNIMCNGKGYQK